MNPYVLVVESDADLQRRIGEALREARYELSAETEITWAKRSLAVRRPDAIVVDTALSDGSGFAFAREVRAEGDTRQVPLFFIASRFRGASHRVEAMRRFAPAEYLSTPLDVDSLLAALLQSVPPEVENPTPRVEEPEFGTAVTSVKTPVVRVAGKRAELSPTERRDPAAGIAPGLTDEAQRKERRDVERRARNLADGEAELRGSLKRTGIARLLQRLYARRSSGALLLLRGSTKKIVLFSDGYPVSIRSNLLGECLGQILVGQKLISEEVLAESLRRMKSETKQQGAVLVEMGALSPYNLQRALTEQLEAKLFDIFTWRVGQFTFKEGGQFPAETGRLDRPTAALILEGIRRHYDSNRQAAVLEDFTGRYVRLVADPVLRLQEMTSDPTELSFIYGLDGRLRLDAVLDESAIPRDKARVLLVALAEARMIEPAESPVRRMTDPRARNPGSGSRPGQDGANPSREQLAAALETLLGQNHFDVLGVSTDATADEVDGAYDTLARDYHPDRIRGKPEELRRVAQEIFDRLTEAHRVLGDAGRRRAYAARLEKSRPAERDDGGTGPSPAAEQLYHTGLDHLRALRHRDAVDALRQAARLVPNQPSYRAALGWALFREAPADARAGRAALGELKRAIQLDGDNARARIYLGHFYAQTGRPDLAVQELETALRLKPGAADVAEELRRLKGGP